MINTTIRVWVIFTTIQVFIDSVKTKEEDEGGSCFCGPRQIKFNYHVEREKFQEIKTNIPVGNLEKEIPNPVLIIEELIKRFNALMETTRIHRHLSIEHEPNVRINFEWNKQYNRADTTKILNLKFKNINYIGDKRDPKKAAESKFSITIINNLQNGTVKFDTYFKHTGQKSQANKEVRKSHSHIQYFYVNGIKINQLEVDMCMQFWISIKKFLSNLKLDINEDLFERKNLFGYKSYDYKKCDKIDQNMNKAIISTKIPSSYLKNSLFNNLNKSNSNKKVPRKDNKTKKMGTKYNSNTLENIDSSSKISMNLDKKLFQLIEYSGSQGKKQKNISGRNNSLSKSNKIGGNLKNNTKNQKLNGISKRQKVVPKPKTLPKQANKKYNQIRSDTPNDDESLFEEESLMDNESEKIDGNSNRSQNAGKNNKDTIISSGNKNQSRQATKNMNMSDVYSKKRPTQKTGNGNFSKASKDNTIDLSTSYSNDYNLIIKDSDSISHSYFENVNSQSFDKVVSSLTDEELNLISGMADQDNYGGILVSKISHSVEDSLKNSNYIITNKEIQHNDSLETNKIYIDELVKKESITDANKSNQLLKLNDHDYNLILRFFENLSQNVETEKKKNNSSFKVSSENIIKQIDQKTCNLIKKILTDFGRIDEINNNCSNLNFLNIQDLVCLFEKLNIQNDQINKIINEYNSLDPMVDKRNEFYLMLKKTKSINAKIEGNKFIITTDNKKLVINLDKNDTYDNFRKKLIVKYMENSKNLNKNLIESNNTSPGKVEFTYYEIDLLNFNTINIYLEKLNFENKDYDVFLQMIEKLEYLTSKDFIGKLKQRIENMTEEEKEKYHKFQIDQKGNLILGIELQKFLAESTSYYDKPISTIKIGNIYEILIANPDINNIFESDPEKAFNIQLFKNN